MMTPETGGPARRYVGVAIAATRCSIPAVTESDRPDPGAADIELEKRDGVAIAWLNRPRVLNAFRGLTFDRLHQVLDQVAADEGVHALVLTGRGRAFCAGEDLGEMGVSAARGFTVRGALRELDRLQKLTRKLADYAKPVIAAVNGPAVGLGAELPLACDIRLAAAAAYFWFPEARRGMLQTNGAFHFLPAIVGHGRATEWLLTACRVPAEEALAAGLVSAVVGQDELVAVAADWARRVAGIDGSAGRP
jgi:enoyl-CoA hydratase/carnithine racemase